MQWPGVGHGGTALDFAPLGRRLPLEQAFFAFAPEGIGAGFGLELLGTGQRVADQFFAVELVVLEVDAAIRGAQLAHARIDQRGEGFLNRGT